MFLNKARVSCVLDDGSANISMSEGPIDIDYDLRSNLAAQSASGEVSRTVSLVRNAPDHHPFRPARTLNSNDTSNAAACRGNRLSGVFRDCASTATSEAAFPIWLHDSIGAEQEDVALYLFPSPDFPILYCRRFSLQASGFDTLAHLDILYVFVFETDFLGCDSFVDQTFPTIPSIIYL